MAYIPSIPHTCKHSQFHTGKKKKFIPTPPLLCTKPQHMHTHEHTYICVYVYVYVNVYVYVHVYEFTYVCTCIIQQRSHTCYTHMQRAAMLKCLCSMYLHVHVCIHGAYQVSYSLSSPLP